MGLFEVTFPVVNVMFQLKHIDIAFIKNGFERGLIPILITSFLIGIKSVPLVFRVFIMMAIRYPKYSKNKDNESDNESEREIFKKFPSLDANKYKTIDLPYIWKCLAQYSIFSISIILLYIVSTFRSEGNSPLVLIILSWAIFFFVDDWIIISDYSLGLDAKPLKCHDIRIKIANLLLTLGVSVLLWSEVSFPYAILGTILVVLFLCWLYFFDLSSYKIKETEHIDGEGSS